MRPTNDERDDRAGGGADPSAGVEHVGIDHVQLVVPAGGLDEMRRVLVDRLGLAEVPRPAGLAGSEGGWFEAGSTSIHVGVDPDFSPARRAHPALLVRNLRRLVSDGRLDVAWSDEIPELERCFVDDPFGNRIELIEAGMR